MVGRKYLFVLFAVESKFGVNITEKILLWVFLKSQHSVGEELREKLPLLFVVLVDDTQIGFLPLVEMEFIHRIRNAARRHSHKVSPNIPISPSNSKAVESFQKFFLSHSRLSDYLLRLRLLNGRLNVRLHDF